MLLSNCLATSLALLALPLVLFLYFIPAIACCKLSAKLNKVDRVLFKASSAYL